MDQNYVCAFVNEILVFDKFVEALKNNDNASREFSQDIWAGKDFHWEIVTQICVRCS